MTGSAAYSANGPDAKAEIASATMVARLRLADAHTRGDAAGAEGVITGYTLRVRQLGGSDNQAVRTALRAMWRTHNEWLGRRDAPSATPERTRFEWPPCAVAGRPGSGYIPLDDGGRARAEAMVAAVRVKWAVGDQDWCRRLLVLLEENVRVHGFGAVEGGGTVGYGKAGERSAADRSAAAHGASAVAATLIADAVRAEIDRLSGEVVA